MKRNILFVLLLAVIAGVSSCKKWDEHISVADDALGRNLLEEINANPDLSKFSAYLQQTGYDKVLASSKLFTVWAPTNTALSAVDNSILGDTTKLKLLIANHISNQAYLTSAVVADSTLRIRALSGKNILFSQTAYDEAAITSKDTYVGNGVLHIVDQAIFPKQSIWEYVTTSEDASLQKQELQSLTYQVRDITKSVVIAYDPKTGEPVYKEGVGIETVNTYLNKDNISNEDREYTYFVLTDAAYNEEKTKLASYFNTGDAEFSDSLTNYNVIKDLAIKGRFTLDKLPETLYSANDSVIYHIDKSAIVKTYSASNGVVYVVNRLDYDMVSKLKPVIIQGEIGYTLQSSKTVQLRTRRNSLNPESPRYNTFFRDLLIQNHGVANYWVKYTPLLKSVTYKVYMRAVRDFDLIPPVGKTELDDFPERIAFNASTATDLPQITNVGAVKNADGTFSPNYDEVYVGDYTVSNYGTTSVFVVGANTKTNGLNTILLDYIKLVPAP